MSGDRIEIKSNLKIGVPNEHTGRIYPLSLFKKYFKKKIIVDLSEHKPVVDFAYVVGNVTDLFVDENNYLRGYLKVVKKNPAAITVGVLLDKGAELELCPVCVGDVTDNVVQSENFALIKMSIITKEKHNG